MEIDKMIKKLEINQKMGRLEYEIEGGWIIDGRDGQSYPSEKLEAYAIMLKVIKNWNANNPTLLLPWKGDSNLTLCDECEQLNQVGTYE